MRAILNRVLRDAGGSDPWIAYNARVVTTWDRIAGDSIAELTADVHLRKRELIVFVSSQAWAADLQSMSEMYREAFNREWGSEVADKVRFQPSRRAFKKRFGSVQASGSDSGEGHAVKPVALTTQEVADIEQTVAHIEDARLKDALFKAMSTDLQWKKGIQAPKSPQNRSE